MRYLVIKLSSLGDVVMLLPALFEIKKRDSAASVTVLTNKNISGILEENRLVDNIVVFEADILKKFQIFKLLKFLKDLRKERYDVLIDFQGLFKSLIFYIAAKAKRKIGFKETRERVSFFYREKIPGDINGHASRYYLSFIPYFFGSPANYDFFEEKHFGIKEEEYPLPFDDYIVACPFTRGKEKEWKGFGEFIENESKTKNIIVCGALEEREKSEEFTKGLNESVLNLTGKLSLRQFYYVCKKAEEIITVDSGAMHIAAATGNSVKAHFISSDPSKTSPLTRGTVVEFVSFSQSKIGAGS